MSSTYGPWVGLMVASAIAGGFGCSGEKTLPPAAATEADSWKPLSDLALPVSLRIGDPAPSDARRIEATDEQLRLDGDPIAPLEKGRVAAGRQSRRHPRRSSKPRLRSPARSKLALRLQANLPYETLALVLNTARNAGMSNAAFQVREIGEGKKTGWMHVHGLRMSSKADDLPHVHDGQAAELERVHGHVAADLRRLPHRAERQLRLRERQRRRGRHAQDRAVRLGPRHQHRLLPPRPDARAGGRRGQMRAQILARRKKTSCRAASRTTRWSRRCCSATPRPTRCSSSATRKRSRRARR